ncbi:L,D-transpeptidase [Leptolyngbya cf. ectocarpi LEGE 11479]|uniref:L,D-transpeptidase n=1 Tax=Leptolyngbya cf. ectocarpi LEGE 11479 TaxID=1828722 RepID=A0A928ZSZ3_LEPEC|nr:L,D-transpeptidase [Leptolyngbya ectocarpi]MBE9067092.1 L,D-transpeptidase [Leptolyngbya cf. ectocarpi LEGE 11479]
MQGLHPLAHSFALLCVGSALGLTLLEWNDPFSWKAANAQPSDVISNLSTRISITNGRRPRFVSPIPKSDTQIVVQLSQRKIDVYRRGEVVKQYLVAVGQSEWETPEGTFNVIHKSDYPAWQHPITGEIVPAGNKNNPLGSHWIGFLSTSDGQIGFHGTNEESLIGEAISHGCIRMLNDDIEDLYTYVEVGTPVTVKR